MGRTSIRPIVVDRDPRSRNYEGRIKLIEALYIPGDENAITADWLQRALTAAGSSEVPAISTVTLEEIGAGVGMVGRILRCRITYQSAPSFAPETIIVKLPSTDDNTRQTARQLQLYQREFDFYRALSAFAPVHTPALLYGDFDSSTHEFVLLLEDLGKMAIVDQVEGATEDQASSSIRTAAELHARFWGRVDQPPVSGVYAPPSPQRHATAQAVYQASLPRVFDIFSDHFTGPMGRLAESYGSHLAEHAAAMARGPQTLIHGDFRLDNMFFGEGDTQGVALVDWQLSAVGSGLYDIAYFLSSCVSTEIRREIERDAIARYQQIIASKAAESFSLEQCWELYRQNMLTCFRVPVIAGAQLDLSNTRSRRLADTILRRTFAAMDDLEVGEFLAAS